MLIWAAELFLLVHENVVYLLLGAKPFATPLNEWLKRHLSHLPGWLSEHTRHFGVEVMFVPYITMMDGSFYAGGGWSFDFNFAAFVRTW